MNMKHIPVCFQRQREAWYLDIGCHASQGASPESGDEKFHDSLPSNGEHQIPSGKRLHSY